MRQVSFRAYNPITHAILIVVITVAIGCGGIVVYMHATPLLRIPIAVVSILLILVALFLWARSLRRNEQAHEMYEEPEDWFV